MDQGLKQRLVGAVVITSLAAIFVPMLFDDPIDETGKMINGLKMPEAPGNSVLNRSKIPNSVDEVISLPDPLGVRNKTTSQNLSDENQRWFIQVGIFSKKENAVALRDTIRKQGYTVTIAEVDGNKGLLHRVRVGPIMDLNKAKLTKDKINKLNNLKGIISTVDE